MEKAFKKMLIAVLMFVLFSGTFNYAVFAADTSALQTAYSETETIINTQDNATEPYYQVDSYQAFIDAINLLGGLVGIQAVIDDPLSTQTTIDNMVSDINNAILGLVLQDTFQTTTANLLLADASDISAYTSTSQTAFHNELDAIDLILNNPTSGEEAVLALNDRIAAAYDILILRGDKTNLVAKRDQIDLLYASDGAAYIPSTFLAFKSAYDNVDNLLQNDISMTLQALIDNIDATVADVAAGETRLDEVLSILTLKPDKTDLINDYNDALTVNGDLYTSNSFSEFTTGLNAILAVINDDEATETIVTQTETDLANLYNLLIDRADLTSLQAAYDTAIGIDLSPYTPDSIVLYQAELSRINDIINSTNTDQTIADAALTDLQSAENILILQADRSQLSTLNGLAISAYYEKKSLYTNSSYTSFKAVVDGYGSYMYVNSIIADDNIDQDTVDNLAQTIQSALSLLVPLADNSALLVAYIEYSDADLTGFTQDSIDAYETELARLYQVITGEEFDSSAESQATLDFTNLSDLLVLLPDFSTLQSLYDSTSIYRNEDYSISSYGALTVAKENAYNVINNKNADQDMVDSAYELLSNAISELNPKAEKIIIKQGESFDINGNVTLGQANILGYYTSDEAIATVNESGIISGINFGSAKIYITLSNGYTEILDIFVEAKLSATVYVLVFSIPIVSIGFGAAVIYVKKDVWIQLANFVKRIFVKK